MLVALDTLSGLALEAQVNSKGADELAETELCKFLIEIGRTNLTPTAIRRPLGKDQHPRAKDARWCQV